MNELEAKDESLKAQGLLGKKLLSLNQTVLYGDTNIGDFVLIMEHLEETELANETTVRELKWSVGVPNRENMERMYEHGYYKLVGIGLVVGMSNYRFQVLVQDTLITVVKERQPF